MNRRFYYLLAALALLAGCASRPLASAYPRIETHAFENTSDTLLGRAYGSEARYHPGQSAFHIINSGPAALMTRVALAEAAQRSLDLQYFTTRDDVTGKLLLEAVIRAADRGVRVRILLDDWYLDDFQGAAGVLNAHPNIDVRIYNPYSTRDQSVLERIANAPTYLYQYDRRMHNKVFIVDNQVAIMGGRNLGDEYFEAATEMNLRDIDVFTAGPITRRISESFDRYWNSDESFPLAVLNLPAPEPDLIAKANEDMQQHWKEMLRSEMGRQLKSIPLPHKVKTGGVELIWAQAELAADSPAKTEQLTQDASSVPGKRIEELVGHAQREFIIFTPYFVPLDKGVAWLNGLVQRGVAVRIVTNSLSSTDMVPAQAGYSRYREALVKGGVELYEIKSLPPRTPGRKMFTPSAQNGLHAKIYMIDRRDLVIGSFNFDPRSVRLNTEQALVIHSPALCETIAELFKTVSAPDASYRVVPASSVPPSDRDSITSGIAWETEEDGKIKYFDFSPHAGFWRRITSSFFSLLPMDDEL